MLDEFRVSKPAGFPDHPHRGFETVRLCECVTKDLQVPDSQVGEFAALPSCVWSFCLGGGSNQFCIFPLENYENSFSVLQHLIDKKRKDLKFAFLKSKSATLQQVAKQRMNVQRESTAVVNLSTKRCHTV